MANNTIRDQSQSTGHMDFIFNELQLESALINMYALHKTKIKEFKENNTAFLTAEEEKILKNAAEMILKTRHFEMLLKNITTGTKQEGVLSMELWKDIPNYEGIYQASTYGRIRSCEGKTTVNSKGLVRVWQQRVLKPKTANRCKECSTNRGDYRVDLWKNGKHKDFLVARLVAMTWVPGYREDLTVNHIDGNYRNNAVTNLEWLTRGENVRAGYETGLYSSKCKKVTLTDMAGRIISFPSQSSADRYLGRSSGYTSVLIGKGYKCVTDVCGQEYIVNVA